MSETALTVDVVKSLAREEGFSRVGVASGDISLDDSAYRTWLAAGMHAEMSYLADHADKRHRPGLLVAGASSILCLAISYAPGEDAERDDGGSAVARHAHGRDYHKVLKQRCHRLMDRLRDIEPSFDGRAFVDTAPVAERPLAAAAGVGWIGRNACLIAGELGSYVLLCEIVCNLSLPADEAMSQGCGDCRLCIDACPTGAIVADGVVDARLCRSYLTIEHRQAIDSSVWPKMDSCLFGCDACQAACPHNQALRPGDAELTGRDGETPTIAAVLTWSGDDWDAATRGSAMRRATYDMFLRNAILSAGCSEDRQLLGSLEKVLAGRADLASEISWAIQQISGR